jgi:asparagine synthase (glutamine-hydrolysing)
MCGIYGTTINYPEKIIWEKLNRFSFRGPDQQGIERYHIQDGQLIFGHNRLSIVDLDIRSKQPFSYLNQVHVVFNGEIYNFKDIREALIKKGYTFKTESDTEVLCASYLEYGFDCVKHFNGMFAFVIYDVKKQLLFGARDRLGKKPFYYFKNGLDFEFCSQLSGIKMHHKKLTVSEKSIGLYLAWKAVPDPFSIYAEVKKLRAGHVFTYSLTNGDFKDWSYWDVINHDVPAFDGDYEDAKSQLKELLMDAVKLRLFADVPVGVFLSGGIDSSLIAALAKQCHEDEIKTFSVKFNVTEFDESEYAKAVAAYLGTNHHTIHCDEREALKLIDNFSYYYDEPFADSSALPSMLLAKYTKQHVTVALSGDGGDETFLGYDRYLRFMKKKEFYKTPYLLRKPIAQALLSTGNQTLARFGNLLGERTAVEAYMATITTTDNSWFDFDKKYFDVLESEYLEDLQHDTLEKISNFETKTYLNWDINTKVDRATMAFSLESRAPLMDYRVIEFSKKLPTYFKYDGISQKRILKDILFD